MGNAPPVTQSPPPPRSGSRERAADRSPSPLTPSAPPRSGSRKRAADRSPPPADPSPSRSSGIARWCLRLAFAATVVLGAIGPLPLRAAAADEPPGNLPAPKTKADPLAKDRRNEILGRTSDEDAAVRTFLVIFIPVGGLLVVAILMARPPTS